MAPNTKQLSRIVQHLSCSDLTLSKTAFVPLTEETKHGETSTTQENYWDWDNECKKQHTDSYWEWTASPEERVLSTEHIVSNLIKLCVQNSNSVQSKDDSIDYWDERSVKDSEQIELSVECVESSDNYWKWNGESQSTSQETRPLHVPQNYWDSKSEADGSDIYWEWPSHADKSLLTKILKRIF